MTPNAPVASPPAIPADVAAFAAEHGVADYVGPLLELTRSLFPGAPIEMLVEEDAEEPELVFIEFRVGIKGLPVDEVVTASHAWSVGLFDRCPATRAHFFCLGML
jgi:hypothetical protein